MTQVFVGLFLILVGIAFGILKNRMLNSAEKSKGKIFSSKNRSIIELRIWIVIAVCVGLGIWLLGQFAYAHKCLGMEGLVLYIG